MDDPASWLPVRLGGDAAPDWPARGSGEQGCGALQLNRFACSPGRAGGIGGPGT